MITDSDANALALRLPTSLERVRDLVAAANAKGITLETLEKLIEISCRAGTSPEALIGLFDAVTRPAVL